MDILSKSAKVGVGALARGLYSLKYGEKGPKDSEATRSYRRGINQVQAEGPEGSRLLTAVLPGSDNNGKH